MNPDLLFTVSSGLAMLGWLVLIFAPQSQASNRLVYRAWLPIAFSVLYAAALGTAGRIPGGGFGSIAEVRTLFSSDWALLAGWVHYLAFDLYIGGILSGKMIERQFSLSLRALILFFTFLFGPVGLLLYTVSSRLKR